MGGYFPVPCGKVGSPFLAKAQQQQERRYPLPSVFSCVHTIVLLPVFGDF